MERKLVLGNPGTGKTYNLVQHINGLIDKGFNPKEITVLSHTRVAAKEITDRSGVAGINASTIHSLAYRLAEISKEQVVNFRDVKEFSDSIGIAMKGNHGETDDQLEVGDEYLATVNYSEATMMPLEWAYNEKGRPGNLEEFKYFCENFSYWKNSYGFVDFNDMLKEAIKSERSVTLPALLVDEAQDLSKRQWKLVYQISKNTKNMLVTGDPDQALFKWGGAWPKGMEGWARMADTEITELSQSYRVPVKAYELSRSIITQVEDRYEKNYKPTEVEGSISRYLTVQHFNWRDLDSALILYRNHALRKSVENSLMNAGKAYTCLNGFPSPLHNKFGRGVKAWITMKKDILDGNFPDNNDLNRVKNIGSPRFLKALRNNDLDAIVNMDAVRAMELPFRLVDYFRHVDFDAAGKILLSTIHGAKGMEHDNVIIVNGMTQRVLAEATQKPDPEYQVWYVAVTRTKDSLHLIDGEGVKNPL